MGFGFNTRLKENPCRFQKTRNHGVKEFKSFYIEFASHEKQIHLDFKFSFPLNFMNVIHFVFTVLPRNPTAHLLPQSIDSLSFRVTVLHLFLS